MRIVAALGGNALLERGEPPDSDVQEAHVVAAAKAIAPLAREHQLIISHGNGPQVGMLAIESATDPALSHPYPFDVLGALTQGMIGYWLIQAMQNELPERDVACLISRTLVRSDDPAFGNPTKFVGPIYPEADARQLASANGWAIRKDGASWRRVVPSPEPVALLDLKVITGLSERGAIVICSGGGGIPVIRTPAGELRGVEAVVDKDLSAALLAQSLGADALLLLTDVGAVEEDFGTAAARPIRHTTPAELRSKAFAGGSMGPKIEAVCRFVESGGQTAAIGKLSDAAVVLAGNAGTLVTA
jgi:carbamate kinase